jgi:3-oxoadipate enol-lactonase
MSAAQVAGVRIAYDVRGDGPPVLFVQGHGYGRGGWGPAPERLAESFTVVTFDNRGFGDSDKPPGPYTTAQLAADALGVLDTAGLERAHVVGASLGGMIAQELALAAPERVERLVLCCTTPGGAGAAPMPSRTVALMLEAPSLDPSEAQRRFVLNALAPAAPGALVDEICAYRAAHPPDPAGWQALAAAGAAHDALSRLGEIARPTLVLHGTADNVVDPHNAELLAAGIPGATLEWFQGAGHLFAWEQSDRFARVVKGFLT